MRFCVLGIKGNTISCLFPCKRCQFVTALLDQTASVPPSQLFEHTVLTVFTFYTKCMKIDNMLLRENMSHFYKFTIQFCRRNFVGKWDSLRLPVVGSLRVNVNTRSDHGIWSPFTFTFSVHCRAEGFSSVLPCPWLRSVGPPVQRSWSQPRWWSPRSQPQTYPHVPSSCSVGSAAP